MTRSHLFCFGLGYSALALAHRLAAPGWLVTGTCRSTEKMAALREAGCSAVLFDRNQPLDATILHRVTHLLASVPPDAAGDPVLALHGNDIAAMPRLSWLGYLSTTGVYGDRGVPVHIFRLAGIYGPGRSALDALRAGTARRIDKPGQVFSRIHVEDLASVLLASIKRPRPGAVYNVCDDDPAPPEMVAAYAAKLLGMPPPPLVRLEAAGLSPMARSFFDDNKRVANRLIKTELGIRLRYPDFRAGLAAILADEACRNRRPPASSGEKII